MPNRQGMTELEPLSKLSSGAGSQELSLVAVPRQRLQVWEESGFSLDGKQRLRANFANHRGCLAEVSWQWVGLGSTKDQSPFTFKCISTGFTSVRIRELVYSFNRYLLNNTRHCDG